MNLATCFNLHYATLTDYIWQYRGKIFAVTYSYLLNLEQQCPKYSKVVPPLWIDLQLPQWSFHNYKSWWKGKRTIPKWIKSSWFWLKLHSGQDFFDNLRAGCSDVKFLSCLLCQQRTYQWSTICRSLGQLPVKKAGPQTQWTLRFDCIATLDCTANVSLDYLRWYWFMTQFWKLILEFCFDLASRFQIFIYFCTVFNWDLFCFSFTQ